MSGLLAALAWVIIIVASHLPAGRFFILSVSSLCIVISWLEWGWGTAATVYLAIFFLSLIWPGPLRALGFLLFYGLYPILFLFLRRKLARWSAIVVINLLMTAIFISAVSILGLDYFIIDTKGLSGWLLWLVIILLIQIVLLVYNYLLGRFTQIWLDRIKRRG
ncbi:MAG: hypothetical protein GX834_01440 [Clostridiaceae bacterium]|nr:hypothetical protein [Clostridiaceae bacterium]